MNLSSDKRVGIEAGIQDECMGSRSETSTIVESRSLLSVKLSLII